MLHKEIPFLRIGLPLCAGIITGLYLKPDILFLVIVILLLVCGLSFSLTFNRYQTDMIYGLTFSLAIYICGILLYTNEKNRLLNLNPVPAQFFCTVSDYPEERENSYKLEIELEQMRANNHLTETHGSMILYVKKDSLLSSLIPGDKLIIKCIPQEIKNRGNPDEFDYRFFLETRGIRHFAFIQSTDIIRREEPVRRKLIHKALIVRQKIINMYQERGITGDRLALVAAITVGQKNMLDPEKKQYFIKAGVMHIMAVSGLHAVILSFFIFKMLFFLRGKLNLIRVSVTLLLLWSFAFITGLTPSVLRATLMFSFLQAGMLMKRPVNSINSVLASAFILILIRPSVIFDAGFLLSYSAVIFIISFYQDLYLKLQFKYWLPDKIWQIAAVTLVAQAGTLSLTIMLFNRFPTWFILSNTLIIPVSSLLIIIGCLVPLTFPIVFISQFLASILGLLTEFTETITQKAASLPWSTIENIGITSLESILLTASIYLLGLYFLRKQSLPAIIPLIVILFFIIAGTFKNISNRTTNELIVYNTVGSTTIGIRSGNTVDIFSDTNIIKPEVKRHCATQGLKIRIHDPVTRIRHIKTGDTNILICDSLNNNIINKTKPDIVILAGLHPEVDRGIITGGPIKKVIISSDVSTGFYLPQDLASAKMDTIHFVRKSGAYVTRL